MIRNLYVGIDASSTAIGIACIEYQPDTLAVLLHETHYIDSNMSLYDIFREIRVLLAPYMDAQITTTSFVSHFALESPVYRFPRAFAPQIRIHTLIELALSEYNKKTTMIAPTEAKHRFCGSGKAGKQLMMQSAQRYFCKPEEPVQITTQNKRIVTKKKIVEYVALSIDNTVKYTEHEADALAIAITLANKGGVR